MSLPTLSGGIDHIHIYAKDREIAADWYRSILGFAPVTAFSIWAEDPNGPLVIKDPLGKISLAIFSAIEEKPQSIAFGATGAEYSAWKAHLSSMDIELTESDHQISRSINFDDPFGNKLEITTYDVATSKR